MKSIIVAVLFCVVFSECAVIKNETIGYHQQVGIPTAQWLMLRETKATRIIGGSEVMDETRYPYQAGIIVTLTSGWTSICGGSLISTSRVLTAAHCWWDGESQAKLFTIVLGSVKLFSGGTRQDTTDILVHPLWNVIDIKHDIAIAKIKAVTLSAYIQVIPLPKIADANQDFTGLTATASGYGKITDAQTSFPSTTSLHHTTVTIISNSECQKSISDVTLHQSHLCTDGSSRVGTCDGDSGGPLTVIWEKARIQVGIVSFGLSAGCEAGSPSVYTRVSAFITWIQSNL